MIGVPKPVRATDAEKAAALRANARLRVDRWRAKARAAAKGKPRTPVKQRNEARIKRKAVAYRKVIASDFHKQMRYAAWERSGGLCECPECKEIRKATMKAYVGLVPFINTGQWSIDRVELAYTEIPIYFVKGAGPAWKRFRSDHGEAHHKSYKFFGDENPAELELIEFTWDVCHQRIEAEHGTRRRFLKGRS